MARFRLCSVLVVLVVLMVLVRECGQYPWLWPRFQLANFPRPYRSIT